jgi:hypothetical protein
MRATEYLNAISNGIGNKELYSHFDVNDSEVREEIKLTRRELKKQASSTNSNPLTVTYRRQT